MVALPLLVLQQHSKLSTIVIAPHIQYRVIDIVTDTFGLALQTI